MNGGTAGEPRRKLALETSDDLEPRVDPRIIGARHLVSEVDEGAKVACLRRKELLVEGVEIGRTALAQRVGEESKPFAGARLDERSYEQPVDEGDGGGKTVSRGHASSFCADDLAQLGGVGIEWGRTERDPSSFELAEHAPKVGKLFLGERYEMPGDLRRVGGANRERKGVARRLHLAVGVIDEHRVHV